MQLTKKNEMYLENRFFYRLIKVLHIGFLSFFFILIFYFGCSAIPEKNIDINNSYVICKSENIYKLSDLNIFSIKNNGKLYNNDELYITEKCSHYTPSLADIEDINDISKIKKFRLQHPEYNNKTDQELADILYEKYYSDMPKEVYYQKINLRKVYFASNSQNYYLSLSHKLQGSWHDVFYWLVLGLISIYVILNIFKETLIYVVFGRKFTWNWLPKLRLKMAAVK